MRPRSKLTASLNLRVSPELRAALDAHSERTGKSCNALVRKAVTALLRAEGAMEPPPVRTTAVHDTATVSPAPPQKARAARRP